MAAPQCARHHRWAIEHQVVLRPLQTGIRAGCPHLLRLAGQTGAEPARENGPSVSWKLALEMRSGRTFLECTTLHRMHESRVHAAGEESHGCSHGKARGQRLGQEQHQVR